MKLVKNQSSETRTGPVFENQFVWTVEDAAQELQCSVRHIRALVSDNRIPYGKIGRLVRFSPPRVREWLSKGGTR
ncbi:MAG: DNA-binding protein [Proteobacteria bacterium]|nr:MAG: DNA-binding protein [Pseudomonadota bacterium]